MSSRRPRIGWLSIIALAGAFSCSVFPDAAVLPSSFSNAGIGGEATTSQAGLGGSSSDGMSGVGAGAGTGALEGGAPGAVAGAPSMVGTGGVVDAPGGAGGAPSGCLSPQGQVVTVAADTWIEAVKPTTGHGNDKTLSVVGGAQERRALLQLTLPAALPGAVLLKATLALQLQANRDAGLALRQLSVHRLEHTVDESRTTWNAWAQGNRAWTKPGGDFGPPLAQAAIPAGTSGGTLTFDVTAAARAALSAQPVPFALIILESGAPPPLPAELAFASREGDASAIPALILEYCEP